MKKLMMAVAVVACAAVASAASFDWKTTLTGKVYSPGTSTTLTSGTAYIFDSAATTQQDILTLFAGGGDISTKALHNKSISSGVISATNGEAFQWSGTTTSLTAFFATVVDKSIFISATQAKDALETGYTQFQFNAATASKAAATATSTFASAGWYTAGAVPEPTSGLLLLLGMAGLALKRKIA